MTNKEIRVDFITLAQVMTAQANRNVGPRFNALKSNMASRLKDFVRTNPPIFLFFKVGEYHHDLLDGIYKIVDVMELTPVKRWSWLTIN